MKVSPTTQTAKASRKNRYLGMTSTQLRVLAALVFIDTILVVMLITLLELNPTTLMACFILASLPFIFFDFIRITQFTQFSGSMRRGIPIWRESLPQEIEESLRETLWDFHDKKGFIRVDGETRLVHAHHSWMGQISLIWPYVAYIDLGAQRPKIEYRTSLGGVLYLIPLFIIFSLVMPFFDVFIIAMMGMNHLDQRSAIRNFILDNA